MKPHTDTTAFCFEDGPSAASTVSVSSNIPPIVNAAFAAGGMGRSAVFSNRTDCSETTFTLQMQVLIHPSPHREGYHSSSPPACYGLSGFLGFVSQPPSFIENNLKSSSSCGPHYPL